MQLLSFVLVTLCVVTNLAMATSSLPKVVCYFGSWSGYRTGNGQFQVEDIDPTLCTHIVYSFVGITSSADVRILDPWNELPSGKDSINRFNRLRTRNPNTKTLIAIGGWNEGSITYSQMANSLAKRATFVKNVVKFLLNHGFDGFDLDWEYPAQRGGGPSDKSAYVELVKDLRTEFDKYGLILSAAVGASPNLAMPSYDIPQIVKYLDFVSLMAYDLHGAWEAKTGQNAPLYDSSTDQPHERALNVDACVKFWLAAGAPAEKLVLGMGLYGRSFTLQNPAEDRLGSPARGQGLPGPYTQESGMLGYNEICEKIQRDGWTVHWDEEQQVPYATAGGQWVGFDDPRSLAVKSRYVKEMGLGGAMVWSVETDDFRGLCGGGKYPLLKAINRVLRGDEPSTPDTSSARPPVPETTALTTVPDPHTSSEDPNDPICTQEGYIRDRNNCHIFYYCRLVNGVLVPSLFRCFGDLAFDTDINVCNYRRLVRC